MIKALQFRLFWLQYRVFYLRSSKLRIKTLTVNGKKIFLKTPTREANVMNQELQQILYEDCYGLRRIRSTIERIVDVGGNIGFFSIAAKAAFPEAQIQCYEPNPHIQEALHSNLAPLNVQVFSEAVGGSDGFVELDFRHGSLYTKVNKSDADGVRMVSIRTVLKRAGGTIDLLKLDCEGAEWMVFECPEWADNVKSLVMEYHLWANPRTTVIELLTIIRDRGFRITHLYEDESLQWGLLHATKGNHC